MNNVLTRRLGAVPRALGRWFVRGFSGTESALCQMALFISALLVGLECNATYWPGLPGAVLFPLGVLTVMELAELGFACREGSKNGLYSLTQEGLEWAQELKEVFRRADRLLPLYVSGEDMQRLSDISDSASEFLKRLSQEEERHENT